MFLGINGRESTTRVARQKYFQDDEVVTGRQSCLFPKKNEFGVLRDLKRPQYPQNEELHEQKKIIEINVVKENRQ